MSPKQRAAEAAIPFVRSGMSIGLGTGSTADFFLLALAAALRAGTLKDVRGVPTSSQCEKRALELGIPLITLNDVDELDLTVDGADEIAPNLDLIKGLGGALLREKIVAQNSKRLIIVADDSKRVKTLGEKAALPVEVVPFAHETHEKFFRSLGASPKLRNGVTDNGNLIYDCRFKRIDDPRELEWKLKSRAGIIETGLFLGIASLALVADSKSVQQLTR